MDWRMELGGQLAHSTEHLIGSTGQGRQSKLFQAFMQDPHSEEFVVGKS